MRFLLVCVLCVLTQAAAVAAARAQVAEPGTQTGCIRGTVISSANSQAVDATVRLDGFENSSTSRAISGLFTFCGLGHGTYEIEASAPGYEAGRVRVNTDFVQSDGITMVLRPQPGHELPRAAGYSDAVSVKSLNVPRQARDQLKRSFQFAARKDWQKCLASLQKAVEIYPDYIEAWTNMGVVYGQLNDAHMAETAFKKALEIDPKDPLVRRKLGYLYLSNGDWDKALAELNISESLDPSDPRTKSYLQYVHDHMH